MLIRDAEVAGRRVDVRLRRGRVAELRAGLAEERGEAVVDAHGGALLPGLHDHHAHLLATASALGSVRCGPPQVRDARQLARRLRDAPGAGWIRGVGYFESVAGDLDRRTLDRWVDDRPARIQHRSGRLWILSSAALRRLGLPASGDGRLFDADAELRARLAASGDGGPPSLAPLGARLARLGVVGVTDATAHNGACEQALLLAARERGELPQALRIMGGESLPEHPTRGELKLVLREDALPSLERLAARIGAAHAAGRAVAFHCVTRTELVFAIAALDAAGVGEGDRIEHASVAPPELVEGLAARGVAVVTQPGFVAERGDDYLARVEPRDRPWLYRGRGFLEAGVALAAATDAPFGEPDPWRALRAAVERRTASGVAFGPEEALEPEEALALFTGSAAAPGGPPRRIAPGEPADLCLLDRPWSEARTRLRAEDVRATWWRGRPVHLPPEWEHPDRHPASARAGPRGVGRSSAGTASP